VGAGRVASVVVCEYSGKERFLWLGWSKFRSRSFPGRLSRSSLVGGWQRWRSKENKGSAVSHEWSPRAQAACRSACRRETRVWNWERGSGNRGSGAGSRNCLAARVPVADGTMEPARPRAPRPTAGTRSGVCFRGWILREVEPPFSLDLSLSRCSLKKGEL
jgi:hypothetical protein